MRNNKSEEFNHINSSERLNVNKTTKDPKKLDNNSKSKKSNQNLIDENADINDRTKIDIYKAKSMESLDDDEDNDKEIINMDIPSLIKGINTYNNCINLYFESIFGNINTLKIFWKLFNSTETIELFINDAFPNRVLIYCKWCKDNCIDNKNIVFKSVKKEVIVAILNDNFKICNCRRVHKVEYDIIDVRLKEFNNLKNDMEKITFIKSLFSEQDNIYGNSDSVEVNCIIKNLPIFSSLKYPKLEVITNFIELNFKYNDNIYKNIFEHFNEINKGANIDSMSYFCEFYFQKYVIENLKKNEVSILDLIEEDLNPDNHSFSFILNKKNRVTNTLTQEEHIKFLNDCGVSYDKFYNISFSDKAIFYKLICYGLYTNQKLLDLYKTLNIGVDINPIFINQMYIAEIFNDLISRGQTNSMSLFDKQNILSKINLRRIFIRFYKDQYKNKIQTFIGMLDIFNFKSRFLDSYKKRILVLLASYSNARNKQYLENKEIDLKKEIKTIMDPINFQKKRRPQNAIIITKIYEYFKIDYNNTSKFQDFTDLINDIVSLNILENLINDCLYKNLELKKLKDILKIMTICCINDIGAEYLYNSCLLDKILRILLIIIKTPKIYNSLDNDLNIENITILTEDILNNENNDNNENKQNDDMQKNIHEIIIEFIMILYLMFNHVELEYKLKKLDFDSLEKNKYYYMLKILFFDQNINDICKGDNYLFFRINLVMQLLDKNNHNTLFSSFSELKYDDSYSDIMKYLLLNLETDNKIDKIFDKNVNPGEMSKEEFKKKYLDEYTDKSKNIKDKKPLKKYYLLIILHTLKSLDHSLFLGYGNFIQKYNKKMPVFNNDLDLVNLIKNESIPLEIKSLFLNFLFIIDLTPKRISNKEKDPNKVYWALTYDYLDSQELKEHLSNTLILIDACSCLIDVLTSKQINTDISFKKKDGIYDISVTIIKEIYIFCNLIINTENIHNLYIYALFNLLIKFYSNIGFFMEITNTTQKNELSKYNNSVDNKKRLEEMKKINPKDKAQEETIMSKIMEVQNDMKMIFNYLRLDLYNITSDKSVCIYDKYIKYYKTFTSFSNDSYSYIYQNDNIDIRTNITLEELITDNSWDRYNEYSNINLDILNNFNLLQNYVNEHDEDGLNYFLKNLDINRDKITLRELFYYNLFKMILNYDFFVLNNTSLINGIIKLVLSDKNYKNFYQMKILKFLFETEDESKINDFFEQFIGKLIKSIYFIFGYVFKISKSFTNTKFEYKTSELLNSLILFFELLGENSETFFHKFVFEYKYNMLDLKDFHAVEKFDKNDKGNFDVKYKIDYKKITPFEALLMMFIQQLRSFNFNTEIKPDNSIIIYNSLTQCIIEYSTPEDEIHKKIIGFNFYIYFLNVKEIERRNYKNIEYEINKLIKNEKNIFVMRNYLLINVFCAKMVQGYFERAMLFLTDIIQMYYYFKEMLNKLNIKLSDDIKKEEKKLIKFYKNKKFSNFPLLDLLILYYEKFYYLDKIQGFHTFKCLLDFDEENVNDLYIILDYIADFFFLNLDKSTVIIMFSFLGKIVKIAEVILNNEKVYIMHSLEPEIFNLSKESLKIYKNTVDRSSRDTKLLSIYDNIDTFLFEIIYNSHKRKIFLISSKFPYKEELNILFFAVENILLIILYYKNLDQSYEEYNEIQTEKESKPILIISLVHIVFLLYVIINWIYSNLKIDYYYSLSEYAIKYLEEDKKVSLGEKAEYFKDLSKDFKPSFAYISKFFKNITKKEMIFIFLKDTLISNSKIVQYLFSFICLILFFSLSQIFLTFPLLLVALYFETLSDLFKAIVNKLYQIISLYLYTFLILYVFSFIGFFYLPNMFKYEPVNKYNEIIEEGELEESICSSSIQCILYFVNNGYVSSGELDTNTISFKTYPGYFLRQFFFNIFLSLLINMIFSNIFYAIITDCFSEIREIATDNEEDMKKVCFICQKTRNDCMVEHIDFAKHTKSHKVEKYIKFICNIILKNETNLNYEEYYIYEMVKKRKFDWFPIHEEDEEEIKAQLVEMNKNIDEKFNKLETGLIENNKIKK